MHEFARILLAISFTTVILGINSAVASVLPGTFAAVEYEHDALADKGRTMYQIIPFKSHRGQAIVYDISFADRAGTVGTLTFKPYANGKQHELQVEINGAVTDVKPGVFDCFKDRYGLDCSLLVDMEKYGLGDGVPISMILDGNGKLGTDYEVKFSGNSPFVSGFGFSMEKYAVVEPYGNIYFQYLYRTDKCEDMPKLDVFVDNPNPLTSGNFAGQYLGDVTEVGVCKNHVHMDVKYDSDHRVRVGAGK